MMKRALVSVLLIAIGVLMGASVIYAQDGVTSSPSIPINVHPTHVSAGYDSVKGLKGFLIVNTATANLRSGDGLQYTVVAHVKGGSYLKVLGRNANASWWYVTVGDFTGWISNQLVIIRGSLRGTPVVVPAGEIDTPRLYLFRNQFVKIVPVEDSDNLCEVAGALEYYIVGNSSDRLWFELETPCGKGWIRGALGAVRNAGNLPIAITYQY